MKKNLRIASAAAAALLAVAPVAASAVNPASASVTVDGNTASNPSTPTAKADGTVTVNINLKAHNNTTVADAIKNATVSVSGVDGVKLGSFGANNGNIKIVDLSGSTPKTLADTDTLLSDKNYAIQINNFTLTGLTTGKTYAIDGGKITSGAIANDTTHAYKAEDLNGQNVAFQSDPFQVYDTSKTGDVSFVNRSSNRVLKDNNVSVDLPAGTSADPYTVNNLAKKITGNYSATVDNGSATASLTDTTAQAAVAKALKDNGIDVSGTTDGGSFTKPAASFVVPVTVIASNGNKATLRVTVNVGTNHNAQTSGLHIAFNDGATVAAPANGGNYTLQLDQNASDTASSIASQFKVTYDAINGASGTYNTPVTVKSSNLNTAVVGKYQVVLTATNPLTNRSQDITVDVTVGHPGKTATVEAGSDNANVVNIDGNNVTATSTNLANGAKVATFGTTDVNGTSYTKINSDDSNEYVLTKYVDGSIKPSESKTTSLDVMYKSAIYDKNGKSTGKHIKGYTSTEFEADKDGNAVEVTINGGKFLKLANDKGYVRTRNVRGSEMTLKHNAYAYKSNGRRANRKLYKKGTKITVYGGQYRAIRHYRKNAVRIGHNRYIKVVNVNYKLAD